MALILFNGTPPTPSPSIDDSTSAINCKTLRYTKSHRRLYEDRPSAFPVRRGDRDAHPLQHPCVQPEGLKLQRKQRFHFLLSFFVFILSGSYAGLLLGLLLIFIDVKLMKPVSHGSLCYHPCLGDWDPCRLQIKLRLYSMSTCPSYAAPRIGIYITCSP
jgi:hypothetical protein